MDSDTEIAATTGIDRRSLLQLGVAAGVAAVSGRSTAADISNIVAMDAVSLQNAIRSRTVSCVEVMTAYLDQIDRLNPAVNAIVALQPREDLIRQARDRDTQLARGEATGPLHGFPHAVKDIQPVKGIRFTQGSPIFRDQIASSDSLSVSRLRKAGVIFVGKTNTPEFALGSHTYNPVYGTTANAYDPSKSAGGSSGGAAVGLALHMLPLADGTDYGGSLRNPAGWNGIYGFRPSIGRVPELPREVWLPNFGVTGPMARNVADLALLLSVQAGADPRLPLSLVGDGSEFRGPILGEVRGKRIAWVGDFGGFVPHEPGVLETCVTAMKTFESLGCIIEDAFPNYPLERVWRAFVRLRANQIAGGLMDHYQDQKRRAQMKPEAIYEVETGIPLTGLDILAEAAVRSDWTRATQSLFQHYDYLIAPSSQVFPFSVKENWPRMIAGHSMQTYHEWQQALCFVTMTGCPSLAVPAGFGSAGQPIGLQIIAPVHRELDCLKLAAAYEDAADASVVRPPALLKAVGSPPHSVGRKSGTDR